MTEEKLAFGITEKGFSAIQEFIAVNAKAESFGTLNYESAYKNFTNILGSVLIKVESEAPKSKAKTSAIKKVK